MYSTKGNPRRVTDEQVERILEWHANRKSMRQFAKEINLAPSTIYFVIQIGGKYKQPSPEKRAAVLDLARTERKRLRASGWL